MELRQLGNSALKTAPVIFGGNVLGWTVDEKSAFRILDSFIDAGFNAIDTADTYSRWVPGNKGGESETIIGNWLAQGGGRRERVLIFTKVGHEMAPDKKGLSRRYITAEVEESLKRLRIDCIDLYQSHRDDDSVAMLETLETYAGLIRAGKVRFIGASNFTAARMAEAQAAAATHNLPRYEVIQPRYNLYDRGDYEGALEKFCLTQNVSVIPYYPLASGFLTGKYRSQADFGKSQRGGAMRNYLNPKGLAILAALDAVGKSHGVNPAAVALAWLLAKPNIVPIASATKVEHLREFSAAASLKLSASEIEILNKAGKY